VLFAVGATARWAADGIYANALMPGGIATNLQRHTGPELIEQAKAAGMRLKTPEQGAATSVLLAVTPELEGVGGRYYEDCAEAEVVERRGEWGSGGVAPYALDPDNADRLWELSERLLGAHVR
jgi:NAD(P)-dependent dehydrogenase (short-subunit alcohol dehydrogenase family)